jgi:hypothetical protein
VFQIGFPTLTNFPGFVLTSYLFFPRWILNSEFILCIANNLPWGPPIILPATAHGVHLSGGALPPGDQELHVAPSYRACTGHASTAGPPPTSPSPCASHPSSRAALYQRPALLCILPCQASSGRRSRGAAVVGFQARHECRAAAAEHSVLRPHQSYPWCELQPIASGAIFPEAECESCLQPFSATGSKAWPPSCSPHCGTLWLIVSG